MTIRRTHCKGRINSTASTIGFPFNASHDLLAKFQVSLVKGDGNSAGVRAHFKSHALQPCFGCRYIEHTSTQSSVYVCIIESELYA